MVINGILFNELKNLVKQKEKYENMVKNMTDQLNRGKSNCKISLLNDIYVYDLDDDAISCLIRCYRKKLNAIDDEIDKFTITKTVY